MMTSAQVVETITILLGTTLTRTIKLHCYILSMLKFFLVVQFFCYDIYKG